MAYDLTRCPQTEDEFKAYLYALIGRTYGAPADDWEAVMEAAYPWQGHMLNIPPGVGPGIRQPPDAPFFGLTQQYSGGPKGRVFLPSNTPDELGYYTRCMQYLDDAAGTHVAFSYRGMPSQPDFATPQSSDQLVWAFYWVAGHEYNPVTDGGSTVPPAGDYQDQIDALNDRLEEVEDAYATLEERLTVVEGTLAGGLHAHGPIDVAILLEEGPSLRAKGDIDVAVKTGQAVPPDMTPNPPDKGKLALILRRLFGDGDEAES